jgi:hypothetical protein
MQAAGEKEQAVDEYRQDYDVSREEAERRLALQGQVDDLREKLIDRLGDGFSEVYFDNTDGMHVVAISSRGRVAVVSALSRPWQNWGCRRAWCNAVRTIAS